MLANARPGAGEGLFLMNTGRTVSKAEGIVRRARDLLGKGRPVEAAGLLRRLAGKTGDRVDILIPLAQAEMEAGDSQAETTFRRALEAGPRTVGQCSAIGSGLLSLGQGEDAVAAYRWAVECDSPSAEAAALLGGVLESVGRTAEAVDVLRQALARRPGDGRLLSFLTELGRENPSEEELARAKTLAGTFTTPPLDRMYFHFVLAKVYDDREWYDEAFHHCVSANALKARIEGQSGNRYDRDGHHDHVARVIDTVTPSFLTANRGLGVASEVPVLIVGMPRSGTTLVEQIISSHPAAFGAGELDHLRDLARRLPIVLGTKNPYPECLGKLTRASAKRLGNAYVRILTARGKGDFERVVDKMWANFLRVGLAAMIVPGARVIHCRRDPMDTCVSCFFQNFSYPLPFVHDLGDLGFYYRQYSRLMDHWRAVAPLPMLEVDYEALVADQERVSREIIGFCGLPWHDDCLSFHRNKRIVATASHQQVRKPIYASSIGRWRRYAAHLEPLRRALGDLVV